MDYRVLESWPQGEEVVLQGYMNTSFDRLVELFGEPSDGANENVDAEWLVNFNDGTFATIYNYRDGVSYLGTSGLPVSQITDWHIGGATEHAADLVQELFDVE